MDELHIRVPTTMSRLMTAKCILIGLAGAGFGILINNSEAADFARGKTLTQEIYLAEFDQYRATLLAKEPNAVLYVSVSILLLAVVFGLYELLSRLLARVLAYPAGEAGGPTSSTGFQPPVS